MHDLSTINDIISTAVKNSSYATVLLSSCVFIIYTIINKVIEYAKTKSRNKPILEMTYAIKDISENVVKLNAVLDKVFKDADKREAAKVTNIISIAWGNFKSEISKECEDIIIHNNVHTIKEFISQNVYKIVSTEYYKLYSVFSNYEINNVNVATKLKEDWIQQVTNECLNIIFNKQDALDRIRQINNKLGIIAEEYATYINNKVFNH